MSDALVMSTVAAAAPVARALADRFALTAVQRDRNAGTCKAERDLLRRSGLLRLAVPARFGGWGADWPVTLSAVRTIAEADASLAQVFGFQHVLVATVELFGTPAQARRLLEPTAAGNRFWGNSLNPLDRRLGLFRTPAGGLVLRGKKSYSTGSTDADALIVSALESGDGRLVVLALPPDRPGIRIHDDWDCFGQRNTDSGGTDFDDVPVEADDILGPPGPLGSPRASLRPCIAQSVFVNVYAGIARGALKAAAEWTRTRTRPWIGSGVTDNTADPYVLERFGRLAADAAAAEAMADRAAAALQAGWAAGDDITPEFRGEVALAVAQAKIIATRAVLDVTAGIFEATGAASTAGAAGLDRFWRNARVLTLHDRIDYKFREVGDHALNGRIPVPSFYS